MKKQNCCRSLTAFLLIIPALLCAQDGSEALRYLEQINAEHNAVTARNLEYIQYSVHVEDFVEVEKKRLEVLRQMDETIKRTSAMPAFQGKSTMRDEMLATVKSYRESFTIEFNEINLLKKESKASYEAMEAYLNAQDAAEKKLGQASTRFYNAQTAFAKEHNIRLTKAAENSEVDQINQVNAYNRAVFLKYFKVSKHNAVFMEALGKEDPKEMERARILLSNDADAALLVLRKMPGFKGDVAYRDAAIKLIEFYDQLADDGYKKITAIKRKKELTQEDVDTFNSVIEHYNGNVDSLLKNYNDSLNQLLRNNIPKPPTSTKRI
ncbi:MAG: hypothetical protein HUU01_00250 [Saprospiraceae bacterium]|nr:hypothetical protein [Saprospiraceae bacterium]